MDAGTVIICPNCRHEIALEGPLLEQLQEEWEQSMRRRVTRQIKQRLLPELEEQAASRAQAEVGDELRDKDDHVRELTSQVERLERQIKTLNRNLPVARAQELGRAREEQFADELRVSFPDDTINHTARGRSGADVVQIVYSNAGDRVGSILWEVKRAKNWQKQWIGKLRKDRQAGRHTVGVIVSDAAVPGRGLLGHLESDLWVAHPSTATAFAAVLRDGILKTAALRRTRSAKSDKKAEVFDYITGRGFSERLQGILHGAVELQSALESERRTMLGRWKRREDHIRGIAAEIVEMVSELRSVGAPQPADRLERAELEALPVPES